MKLAFEIGFFLTILSWVSSSISGISYMDPLNQRPLKNQTPGNNPCNPLYWYPRQIPEYCYNKVTPKPAKPMLPAPAIPVPPIQPPIPPIPIPLPMPPMAIPMPYPIPLMPPIIPYPPPMPMFPPAIQQYLPPVPYPPPMPQMPVPYPPPMPQMPVPFGPYPSMQAGLVPGIQGLVTQDGGINILPFSDAYSDMLEKHKQKIIRKRLQKVLDRYENYPRKRKHRSRGRYY